MCIRDRSITVSKHPGIKNLWQDSDHTLKFHEQASNLNLFQSLAETHNTGFFMQLNCAKIDKLVVLLFTTCFFG